MAIGTIAAGPGVPLTIPVIDLAPLAAEAPDAPDTVAAAVAWFTGQNYHGEADTPPPR